MRPACDAPAFDEDAFVRLVRIELESDRRTRVTVVDRGSATIGAEPPSSVAVLSLDGACSNAAALDIVVENAATAKRVRRSVVLADLPAPARARALALASAELVRASWGELVSSDAPPRDAGSDTVHRETIDRGAPAASVVGRRAPPERVSRSPRAPPAPWFVSTAVAGRYFSAGGVALLGGSAGASVPVRRSALRLRLEGGAWSGTTNDALGQIALWLATGALGGSVGARYDAADVEMGARVELGWAHASGSTSRQDVDARSGGTLAMVVSLPATGRLQLGSRWWAVVELELGAVVHGLSPRVDDRIAGELRGAVGGARLGLALSL